jgi:hypothetical protein
VQDVVKLDGIRHIVSMAIPDLKQDPQVLQDFASRGVSAYRAAMMPWFKAGSRQNVGDAIDDIADWYLRFRPDLLKEALGG